ncbi:uncharacterized protein [Anabrus simplex]|uniref:uncharacterized protein n=1 Tax=Anabrus simplex TaxID=316456 RepID=UPI0035A2BBFC
MRICRLPGEQLLDTCTAGRRHAGGGSIMLWGTSAWAHIGLVELVQGTMTAKKYRQLFADHILGFCLMVNEARYAVEVKVYKEDNFGVPLPSLHYDQESRVFHLILSISGALNMVLSLLLVHGAKNENPRLMKPWLTLMTCVTIFTVLVFLFFIIRAATEEGFGVYLIYSFSSLIFVLPSMVLTAYCILVVQSFRKELVEAVTQCYTETTCITKHISPESE